MKKITMRAAALGLCAFLAGAFSGSADAQDLPFTVQGSVRDNGTTTPADGGYNMRFRIFDAATLGTQLYEKTFTGGGQVQILNGVFSVSLGDTPAFSAGLLDGTTPLFLEIAYDRNADTTFQVGEVFAPRRVLRASSRAEALTVGDKTIEGNLGVVGRSFGDVVLAAPLGAGVDVNHFFVNVANVALGAVRGLQVFARGSEVTRSGFVHGQVTALHANARATGEGSATAVQPNALFEGSNVSTDPTVMPSMLGVNATAGLHPSTTTDKAVFAYGGVFTASTTQAGSNVGVAGSAISAASSNVGVTGSAGVTLAEALGVTIGLPAGFTSGGFFVNLDPEVANNTAVTAIGNVVIESTQPVVGTFVGSGTFSEGSSTIVPSAPIFLLPPGNVIGVMGIVPGILSLSPRPPGTTIKIICVDPVGMASFVDSVGGPLRLNGAAVVGPDDTLVLTTPDGLIWYEMSRSIN